jgi:hypothetical protein
MKYELLTTNLDGVKIYARIDEDGLCRFTCTEDNPEYQAWLNPKAEQSTLGLVNSDNPAEPVV